MFISEFLPTSKLKGLTVKVIFSDLQDIKSDLQIYVRGKKMDVVRI